MEKPGLHGAGGWVSWHRLAGVVLGGPGEWGGNGTHIRWAGVSLLYAGHRYFSRGDERVKGLACWALGTVPSPEQCLAFDLFLSPFTAAPTS